jgi:alanyl-tRNA synthetase
VLLTTAGMQQFKDYFSGKRDVQKKLRTRKVVTIQKCFRTSDIDEIGDKNHLTFLEMLGNFAFDGKYWKKEAISFVVEFLIKNLGIKKSEFKITVFKGSKKIPFDKQSYQIWLNMGFKKSQISKEGKEDNFWGPTGDEGPCGPTTEVYLGGTEIWNIVFNEYFKDKKGNLVPLAKKGVDTGMGLERLAMFIQKKKSVFGTDLFMPLISILRKSGYAKTKENLKQERIIADHIRGIVFLISEGLSPSNLKEGYILRRILRRSIRAAIKLKLKEEWYISLISKVIEKHKNFWPEIEKNQKAIISIIEKEEKSFRKALNTGVRELEKKLKHNQGKKFSGKECFQLYESYGFPPELTKELLEERGYQFDDEGFENARREHQKASRTITEKKKGGIRINPSYYEIKLHTATHLLHQALRDVLGSKIKQMGSDINEKRLRFDFNFGRAIKEEEIKEIEKIVNQKIKQDLKIDKIETTYEQAIKEGCLGFFKEKYPKKVSIFKISLKEAKNDFYSCEICRGPHAQLTSELKSFKIIKQESVGAGVRRIKAKIEK